MSNEERADSQTPEQLRQLERRVETLEQENDEFRETMQERASAETDRRRFLGGLVGGSALLGAAVQPGSGTTQSEKGAREEWVDRDGDNRLELPSHDGFDVDLAYSKKYPTVDVDAFGAVGDGETDDSVAIQAAADSISGKAALAFSPGKRYRLGSTVSIDVRNVRAVQGNNAYVINDTGGVGLEIYGTKEPGGDGPEAPHQHKDKDQEWSTIIEGLQIYSTTAMYSGIGMQLHRQFEPIVTNCHFFNNNHGLEVGYQVDNLVIDNCNFWDNRTSNIHFNDEVNSHQIVIGNCHINYSKRSIFVDSGARVYNLHLAGVNMEAQAQQQDGFENFIYNEGKLVEMHIAASTFQDHNIGTDALIKLLGNTRRISMAATYISNTDGDGVVIDSWNLSHIAIGSCLFEGIVGDAVSVARGEDVSITGGVYREIGGDAVVVDTTDRVNVSGSVMSRVGGTAVRVTGDNEILTVNAITGKDIGQFVDSTARSLGVKIDDNNVRPRTAPAISIDSIGDIWNLSLNNNSIYWNSASVDETGNGYVVDVTTDSLYTTTVKDTKITGRGGSFDGAIRVDPSDSIDGVILRDNIADELTAADATYALPDAKVDSVIVADNLDVR